MKKIAILVFWLLFILIILNIISITIRLYWNYTFQPANNIHNLSNINSAVQIGYNIIYLIVATTVLAVAYFQLDKTRIATTIPTLINIDKDIRSDDFLKKRKKLAEVILINEVATLKSWLEKFNSASTPDIEDVEQLACIKNIFEAVIYEFELIGHFYKKSIFSIEDVYQLFSIEIQNYWILMSEVGYIKYLRENEHIDYYDKFQNIFDDILKQEIINQHSNLLLKYWLKFYYWSRMYRIFYKEEFYVFGKKRNKISLITLNIEKKIPLFLKEEKNLID